MKNYIELSVVKRQRLCHIRADELRRIPLAFCDGYLAVYLRLGIIEHGALRAERRKNGYLLSSARGKPQKFFALYIPEPFVRNGFGRRQQNLPLSCFD